MSYSFTRAACQLLHHCLLGKPRSRPRDVSKIRPSYQPLCNVGPASRMRTIIYSQRSKSSVQKDTFDGGFNIYTKLKRFFCNTENPRPTRRRRSSKAARSANPRWTKLMFYGINKDTGTWLWKAKVTKKNHNYMRTNCIIGKLCIKIKYHRIVRPAETSLIPPCNLCRIFFFRLVSQSYNLLHRRFYIYVLIPSSVS